MATSAVNQIEVQFAHLTPEEQLELLGRLVQDFRVGGWGARGLSEDAGRTLASNSELRHRLATMTPELDSRGAAADLLNDVY